MSFNGKVIIITGANSGIGEDAAIQFAKHGANVVIVARNQERLEAVVEKITKSGYPTPLAVSADVSKDAKKIIDQTIKTFGRLDVLINNAGIVRRDTASTVNLDEYDSMFATNCRGVVELTKLSVPYLEKTKGNIINVSSIAGIMCHMRQISYCMTKAALDMYTKCASLELAPKGIRVNSLNPGMTKTPILDTMGVDVPEFIEETRKLYPIGRVGEVADTSEALLFLASEKASFVTGVLFPVDGGRITVGV